MVSKIWGGRFSQGPADIMETINASIGFDKRLAQQDIRGSQAHCAMLVATGILSKEDGNAILDGLNRIAKDVRDGGMPFKRELEDIHMNIEARLSTLIGEPAGRLHTARSRNDQVATDFKIWVREAIETVDGAIQAFQKILITRAEAEAATVMPGFTHLQTAQPVTFGHHLLAYVEMLGRDRGRLKDCATRLNECPLGVAALAGTSFPVDREMTAKKLDFDRPTYNSLDSVSDRDFALEYLSALAILATHLSRLAEELVIWTSDGFNFVTLSDSYSTGSSIMPQKRNPDAAELVRAKTGRFIGWLNGLLVTMKGLPMAYSKDMQEDKEPVFDASDTMMLCLAAMTGMVETLTVNADAMKAAAGKGFSTATDLADWLVRELNIPFRDAHHITGSVVKLAEENGCGLEDLTLEQLQSVHADITAEAQAVLSVDSSVASRTSYGGTAPDNVRAQAAAARDRFLGGR